jgi:hypothetical protein
MGGTCREREGWEKEFESDNLKGRGHLEDLGVDERYY